MPNISLTGLDGGNLLGFLAALGTLRILSKFHTARLSWKQESWWMPIIDSDLRSEADLLSCISSRLCGANSINPAWEIDQDLKLSIREIHENLLASAARAGLGDRTEADFLCAFGSDVFGTGPKKEFMSNTELRAVGGGPQHFLGSMKELALMTTEEDLARTLFSPWDYQDGRPSLRWDPADFRPHALRAMDPSTDPILTMRGANRLAIEAMPLFPTAPAKRRLRTVGFEERNGQVGLTWPIWRDPLDLDTVKSLLALEDIQTFEEQTLVKRGIAQVFRTLRFTEGKYRNFSPAKAQM